MGLEIFIVIMSLVIGGAAIEQSSKQPPKVSAFKQGKKKILMKRVHCENLDYGVKACWKTKRIR